MRNTGIRARNNKNNATYGFLNLFRADIELKTPFSLDQRIFYTSLEGQDLPFVLKGEAFFADLP
jgi:hypothetical protein